MTIAVRVCLFCGRQITAPKYCSLSCAGKGRPARFHNVYPRRTTVEYCGICGMNRFHHWANCPKGKL